MPNEVKVKCQYPGCTEPSVSSCECCGSRFCEEHGMKGGDRLLGEVLSAVPSVCRQHGGF